MKILVAPDPLHPSLGSTTQALQPLDASQQRLHNNHTDLLFES